MKTTSGAHVVVLGDTAYKFGWGDVGRRIVAQGQYINWLGSDSAPRVKQIFRGRTRMRGYAMERLNPCPTLISAGTLTEATLSILMNHVWIRPANVGLFDFDVHTAYVTERLERYAPWAETGMRMLFDRVRWREVQRGAIHGDPTFENIMVDDDGRVVITDPLPPNNYIPHLIAVDVGKILQSLYGYEHVKTGRYPWVEPRGKVPRPLELVADYVTHEDLVAASYFCAVHYLRLMPYQPERLHEELNTILGVVLWDGCNA